MKKLKILLSQNKNKKGVDIMITEPSAEDLLDKVDSIYTLVILSARRARHINVGGYKLLDVYKSKKPISMSLEEIAKRKITYKKNQKVRVK